MKKKSIKKLTINKTSISNLKANTLKGGRETREVCETIDVTRCQGEEQCHIYQTVICL